jgi:hypothetical protein
MKYKLDITIPILPKTSSNANKNWRGRWAESVKIKRTVSDHLPQKLRPEKPLAKAKLTLTRHAHGRVPDFDGLVASFKHVVDALTICRIILDDNYDVIGMPKFIHMPAKPKHGFIRIIVEEV